MGPHRPSSSSPPPPPPRPSSRVIRATNTDGPPSVSRLPTSRIWGRWPRQFPCPAEDVRTWCDRGKRLGEAGVHSAIATLTPELVIRQKERVEFREAYNPCRVFPPSFVLAYWGHVPIRGRHRLRQRPFHLSGLNQCCTGENHFPTRLAMVLSSHKAAR